MMIPLTSKWLLIQTYWDADYLDPICYGPFKNLVEAITESRAMINSCQQLVAWQHDTPKNMYEGFMIRGIITERERQKRYADCFTKDITQMLESE